MGLVLQMQPGAITDLMLFARTITSQLKADGQFQTSGSQPLFFLGISAGVGTCARGRTVPVAVFGLERPKDSRSGREELPACAFAVLARSPSTLEQTQGERQFGTPCLDAVELLELAAEQNRDGIQVLRQMGIVKVFVNI